MSCEQFLNLENAYWIGFDLYSRDLTTLSNCCLWCFNISSCHAFTFDTFSSTCYLKSTVDNNQILDQRYQSAKVR